MSKESFVNSLQEANIIDSDCHSEFSGGQHGKKINFDLLRPGQTLWDEWVDLNVAELQSRHKVLPRFVISVANGTIGLTNAVAQRFSDTQEVDALHTFKDTDKIPHLRDVAAVAIEQFRPKLVVFLEDVSTEGSKVVTPAVEALECGAHDVVVQTTWKRRSRLEYLDQEGIDYYGIIDRPMPSYSPGECAEAGFCFDNLPLRPYGEESVTINV